MSHESTELKLYIDNDYTLYSGGQRKSIIDNLLKRKNSGKYDSAKSVDLWNYYAETGAKKYAKDHAKASDWHRIFSVADRKQVARELRDDFESGYSEGEHTDRQLALRTKAQMKAATLGTRGREKTTVEVRKTKGGYFRSFIGDRPVGPAFDTMAEAKAHGEYGQFADKPKRGGMGPGGAEVPRKYKDSQFRVETRSERSGGGWSPWEKRTVFATREGAEERGNSMREKGYMVRIVEVKAKAKRKGAKTKPAKKRRTKKASTCRQPGGKCTKADVERIFKADVMPSILEAEGYPKRGPGVGRGMKSPEQYDQIEVRRDLWDAFIKGLAADGTITAAQSRWGYPSWLLTYVKRR